MVRIVSTKNMSQSIKDSLYDMLPDAELDFELEERINDEQERIVDASS